MKKFIVILLSLLSIGFSDISSNTLLKNGEVVTGKNYSCFHRVLYYTFGKGIYYTFGKGRGYMGISYNTIYGKPYFCEIVKKGTSYTYERIKILYTLKDTHEK